MPYNDIKLALERNAERRERQRDLLAQSAQVQPTQMVSGRAVPYSPIQGLTQIAQAVLARSNMNAINKKDKELNEQMETERKDAFQKVVDKMRGMEQSGGPLRYGPGEEYQQYEPAVEPDPMGAAVDAYSNPYTESVGEALLSNLTSRGTPSSKLYSSTEGFVRPDPNDPTRLIKPTLDGNRIPLPIGTDPNNKYLVNYYGEAGNLQAKGGAPVGDAPMSEADLAVQKQDAEDDAAMKNPNSPQYIAQKDQHSKDLSAVETMAVMKDNNISKIDEILSPENKDGFEWNFGGYAEKLVGQFIFTDQAAKVQNLVDSLKDGLKTEGKAAVTADGTSPGQITEREWPILESQLAKLDRRLGEADARELLKDIRRTLERIGRVGKKAYDTRWKGTDFYGGVEPDTQGSENASNIPQPPKGFTVVE